MSLPLATLVPGLIFLALGGFLFANTSFTVALLRGFPRSRTAAAILFGGGALWFLWILRGLTEADLIFFESPTPVMAFFAVLSVLAFFHIPDFLAVRGLSVWILLGAWPIVMSAYGEYDRPQRLLMVTPVYLAVAAAIYLGSSPFRLRDFLEWLFRKPGRARGLGGALAAYGLLLAGVAFSY